MTLIHRLISAGFATAALASASVPALAFTVWPDVDFEWYANVGKPVAATTVEVFPASRAGYIWSPGHYERQGARQVWVDGQWIKDDYKEQVAMYSHHEVDGTIATGPTTLYDRFGNPIPTSPESYPIGSAQPATSEASSLDSSRR